MDDSSSMAMALQGMGMPQDPSLMQQQQNQMMAQQPVMPPGMAGMLGQPVPNQGMPMGGQMSPGQSLMALNQPIPPPPYQGN